MNAGQMLGTMTVKTHPVFAHFAADSARQLVAAVDAIAADSVVAFRMPAEKAALRESLEAVFADKSFLVAAATGDDSIRLLIGLGIVSMLL